MLFDKRLRRSHGDLNIKRDVLIKLFYSINTIVSDHSYRLLYFYSILAYKINVIKVPRTGNVTNFKDSPRTYTVKVKSEDNRTFPLQSRISFTGKLYVF